MGSECFFFLRKCDCLKISPSNFDNSVNYVVVCVSIIVVIDLKWSLKQTAVDRINN